MTILGDARAAVERIESRERYAPLKPRMGGLAKPIKFTGTQIAILNAASDQIIPGGEGYPWPSSVGIVDFIGRYVTPSGEKPRWFPFAGEDDFKAEVDKLGEEFLAADSTRQVEILMQAEREAEEFFTQLRNLVYYGYYARPEVTKAINENLEAGRDYRGVPQPYGYLDVIEEWDEAMFSRVTGDYKRTEDVKRVSVRSPKPAHEGRSVEDDSPAPGGSPAPGDEPSVPAEK